MAPAGAPVLSLLPAGALKVEFYVAEADRMRLAMGQTVTRRLRRLRRGDHGQGELSRLRAAIYRARSSIRATSAAGWCSSPRRGSTSRARHSAGPAGDRRARAMSAMADDRR